MRVKSKNLRRLLTLERGLLLTSITLILFIYRDFLLSPAPAGWDTLPQIHLFFKMAQQLKEGRVFGYDLEWFGGFPIFIFYGFLPYLLAALVHVITLGAIPMLFLAKLTIIGTPIFFLIAVYIFVGVFLGKNFRFAALIAFQGFLFVPLSQHMGIGLVGAIHHGLFVTLLGSGLILLTLVCLEKYERTAQRGYYVGAIFLAASIFFSHVISSAVAACVLSIYFFQQRRFKEWLSFGIWVLALTAFYLYPYLAYYSLTNGSKMSALYTDSHIGAFIGINWPGLYRQGFSGFSLVKALPPLNLLLLASFFVGLNCLIKERKAFLPAVFFFYLFFIVSDYFYYAFDLPLHYYRFHTFFFGIYLIIAARGLGHLMEVIAEKAWLSDNMVKLGLGFFVLPFLVGFHFQGETLDWENNYRPEHALMETLASLKPQGRVFVERTSEDPNPHLFSVYLPLQYHIPVLFGLLIESSDNARYITPPIMDISENLTWGIQPRPLMNQSYEEILLKLEDLGTEYIALERPQSMLRMEEYIAKAKSPLAKVVNTSERYRLYKLYKPLPFLSTLRHKPILCINTHSSVSNEGLLDMFYRSALSPEIKLSFLEKKNHWPTDLVLQQFGTLILVGEAVNENVLRKVLDFKGEVILLVDPSSFMTLNLQSFPRNLHLFNFFQINEFFAYLQKNIVLEGDAEAIEPLALGNNKLSFRANGPVVVNMGYFPYWQSRESAVFRLSPSKLLVLGQGETTLEFHLPMAQKVLSLFALLSAGLLLASLNPKFKRLAVLKVKGGRLRKRF